MPSAPPTCSSRAPLARTHRLGSVNVRQRKHWGWGFEDQQPTPARGARGRGRARRAPAARARGRCARRGRVAGPAGGGRAAGAAGPAAPASLAQHLRGRRSMRARRTRSASPTPTSSTAFAVGSTTPPTSSPARAMRATSSACSSGARPSASPRSPTVGAPPSSAASPRTRRRTTTAPSRSTSSALDRVLEVDPVSRAALIQAGASGPGLEAQLAEHGLTLRHFPQSFEYSTLGGWIATRAAGHFATVLTHIEDFVESIRAITPAGAWESRRLPGSGAGVSPDRMLAGSEGILGVITQAWVRVQPRPSHRASARRALRALPRRRRVRARAQPSRASRRPTAA